jgi:hypothetical protein
MLLPYASTTEIAEEIAEKHPKHKGSTPNEL